MPDSRLIDKTHLTAVAPDGDTLAVVTYTSGRCGVVRNGRPVHGLEWEIERIAESVTAMIQLAGLNSAE